MGTIETELVEDGSKRDERGRQIRSAEERTRLLSQYEASGLTQKKFARREGIKYATFTVWLSNHQRGALAADRPRFVEGLGEPEKRVSHWTDKLDVEANRSLEMTKLQGTWLARSRTVQENRD